MHAAEELFKRLHEELERQHRACVWLMEYDLYDDIEYVYHVLYNKPTECDMASVKIKRRGDEISVTYDVSYYICAVYDEEDDGEASGGDEEQCLEEAERIARLTLDEYRRLMAKWAEELGVQTEEELKKDGSTFTLTVRVAPTVRITPS